MNVLQELENFINEFNLNSIKKKSWNSWVSGKKLIKIIKLL